MEGETDEQERYYPGLLYAERPSDCVVNVGFWGRKKGQFYRFFTWSQVSIPVHGPLNLQAGDHTCTETRMTGHVKVTPEQAAAHPQWMSDAGEMEWDIQINKQVAYHVGYGASRFFYTLNAFEMFWNAKGMKTAYDGWLRLNGEKYRVRPDTCYGYADKNWVGTSLLSLGVAVLQRSGEYCHRQAASQQCV